MIGPREVCPSCHRPHPDLHLPADNTKDKTLAMDHRDIQDLIGILRNTASAVTVNAADGYSRGFTACTDTVVGLLNNYVAAS